MLKIAFKSESSEIALAERLQDVENSTHKENTKC